MALSTAGRAVYRLINAVEIDTYRPIVDQADIHHGAEDPVFDSVLAVEFAYLAEERVVQFLGSARRSGFVKVGFVAFLSRGEKSELRY